MGIRARPPPSKSFRPVPSCPRGASSTATGQRPNLCLVPRPFDVATTQQIAIYNRQRLADRKDGTTCSQFPVYTDDLPGLQEYVQAHNAGDGEFKVDLHRRRSAERPVATPALQSGVFLQQYPKPV